KLDRGRLVRKRRPRNVENDARRGCRRRSDNRIADKGINVVSRCEPDVSGVAPGVPKNAPLGVVAGAAGQRFGVEGEWVGRASRHRYCRLGKLNDRSRAGAGDMDFKFEGAGVRAVVRSNPIDGTASGSGDGPVAGNVSAAGFE